MIGTDNLAAKITDLNQICIIVHDIEKNMALLWNTFGIGPWDIYIRDFKSKIDRESIREMTYHGKPAQFSYKMAITHNKIGGFSIELIEPVAGDNIYRDFLKEKGEGVHHIGWHEVDSQETFTATWKRFEQKGFRCIMSGRVYNCAFAYFDTDKVLHTILELVWRDNKKERPAPAMVFPEQQPPF